MGIQLQKLWIRVALWAFAEIGLSTIGLDTLADYSEFIFDTSQYSTSLGTILLIEAQPGDPNYPQISNTHTPSAGVC